MPLKVGDIAPDFTVKDQQGTPVSLKDFRGRKVALYFYPKDNTPTCTVQACNIRDNVQILLNKGIVVIGASVDSERRHQNFTEKYRLNFPLLADVDKQLVNAYDVWGEKKMFGKKYMGTSRVTFLINEAGRIDHVLDKVDAAHHAQQILDAWNL